MFNYTEEQEKKMKESREKYEEKKRKILNAVNNINRDAGLINPEKENEREENPEEIKQEEHDPAKSKDIGELEGELQKLFTENKNNWIKIFEIVDLVQANKLYEDEGLKSFTQWVATLSEKLRVSQSLIWARYKEGKIYASFYNQKKLNFLERQREGERLTREEEQEKERLFNSRYKAENLTVSPDNFVLCDKIARGNETRRNELIDKVINNELQRKELRALWSYEKGKAKREKELKEIVSCNGYTNTKRKALDEAGNDILTQDIVEELLKSDWIEAQTDKARTEQPYFKAITEFPVWTGKKKNARIDLLATENITTNYFYDVMIHGVEIKISRGDFLRDKKMTDYLPFCDVFWLACPKEMQEVVEENLPENIGIILFEREEPAGKRKTRRVKFEIYRQAKEKSEEAKIRDIQDRVVSLQRALILSNKNKIDRNVKRKYKK